MQPNMARHTKGRRRHKSVPCCFIKAPSNNRVVTQGSAYPAEQQGVFFCPVITAPSVAGAADRLLLTP